jgi:peptidoglycan/xylan/chitin deacetylase (PgdA/CDA1 family)
MTAWLICDVDTEFDSLRNNIEIPSRSNPGLTKGVPELLDFFDKHKLNATFHLQEQQDPNISIVNRYPEIVDKIKGYGHEISLHTHMRGEDFATRKTEIEAGFNRLSEGGFKVISFRAGWYFTNENTIRILEGLDVKYDCSPYKNLTVGSKRWIGIPDSPYHPDYKDLTKIGQAKILIIPINDIRLGIGIHRNDRRETLVREKGLSKLISISQETKQPTLIFFTTHSWKPVDEKGKIREWEKKRREEFIEFLGMHKFRSLTVKEAGKLWDKHNYKPYFFNFPDFVRVLYPQYNHRRYFWIYKNLISRAHILRYKLFGKL